MNSKSIDLTPIYSLIKTELDKNSNLTDFSISSKRDITPNDSQYEEYEGWQIMREEFSELFKFILVGNEEDNFYYDIREENITIANQLLENLFENKYSITITTDI